MVLRAFGGNRSKGPTSTTNDKTVQQIHVALGDANWESLCADGAGMTVEQVTALALPDEPMRSTPDTDPVSFPNILSLSSNEDR